MRDLSSSLDVVFIHIDREANKLDSLVRQGLDLDSMVLGHFCNCLQFYLAFVYAYVVTISRSHD